MEGRKTRSSKERVEESEGGNRVVSCPTHTCLPARNSLVNKVEFLGLITQNG